MDKNVLRLRCFLEDPASFDDDVFFEELVSAVHHPDAGHFLQVFEPVGHLAKDQGELVVFRVLVEFDVTKPHHELKHDRSLVTSKIY